MNGIFKVIKKDRLPVLVATVATVIMLISIVTIYPHGAIADSVAGTSMLAKVDLPFIQNQGQTNDDVKFYANNFGGTVFVTKNDLTYTLNAPTGSTNGLVLKEKFLSQQTLNPEGRDQSNALVNYFVGPKENWHSNIATYNTIDLGQVWQSVDVKLYAHGDDVEKVFQVLPGGSIHNIQVSLDGVKSLSVSNTGELTLGTDLGQVVMTKPLAYQEIDGTHKTVNVSYHIEGKTYGFNADSYNTQYPLIIDPVLASTFVGGTSNDESLAMAIDGSGNVFIAGRTSSTNYPTTAGAYQTTTGGGSDDVFVSKLSNDLTTLQASTFIGGSNNDQAFAINLDGSGNVFVSGLTQSSNYPTTTGAYQTTLKGTGDVFVSKLSNNLTSLEASTLVGGSAFEGTNAMTLDGSGNVFVTGVTNSTNYPTTAGAYQTTLKARGDVFVSKLSNDLTTLQASTFIGGSNTDRSFGIALDGLGNVFVTGQTSSSNYPTTAGAYQTTNAGGFDGFVSKLNSGLTSLQASTFIGGTGNDKANAIALDGSGNVFVTGQTVSTNYPTTAGAYQTTNAGGTNDIFVSKLNSGLTSLQASTFIGGTGNDISNAITLDGSGNVFVTGATDSTNYPTTAGAYQTTNAGGLDVFVSKLNSGLTSLQSSTFIGGGEDEGGNSISLDASGNIFVTGTTESTNYPTTAGAYQTTNAGGTDDAFVTKITSDLIQKDTTSVSTTLSGSSIPIGSTVTDSATLSGNTANAGGTVTYNIYNNTSCTGTPVFTSTVPVTSGIVPSSGTFTPSAIGNYMGQAVYSGDSNNQGAIGLCNEPLTVTPLVTVGGSYTETNVNFGANPVQLGTPLSTDGSGDSLTKVILSGKNKNTVSSTNPGQIYSVTTISSSTTIQSLKINGTLPVNWNINPPKSPGGVTVLFMPSGSTTVTDITNSATIVVTSATDPTTNQPNNPSSTHASVSLSISNIASSAVGKALGPGDKLMVYIKLQYDLKGDTVNISNYPVTSPTSTSIKVFSGTNYSGSSQTLGNISNLKISTS